MRTRACASIALLMALAVAGGPGVAVRAQSPDPSGSDACALLTDQEVLDATGAAAITRTEAVSSLSAAGYGAGCTRDLEPPGGLPVNATFTLDYGVQSPGGRQVYDGQLAVTPGATHVAGMGDDAFQGLSDEWYAVKGDVTVGLSLIGIGLSTDGLHRGDIARRALLWRLMSRLPGEVGPPVASGPPCLLDPDALSQLVALPFDSAAAGALNCLYAGGPTTDGYALDIRFEDPPIGSSDATLDLVSLDEGEATTVADLPAWTSDEALWVDLGVRLLVVQPMWWPVDTSRPTGAFLRSIAERVIERVPADLANPTPAPTPLGDTDLGGLFPSELKEAPVTVQTVAGADLAGMLGDPGRLELIESVLAEHGRTFDDLSMGVADLFNANDRSGSIIAIRVRGADAASFGIPLLLAVQGVPDLPIGQTRTTIGDREVMRLEIPGRDPAVPVFAWTSGDIAWFIESETCVRYTPEQGCEDSQVDQPLLEEILAKLP